MKSLRFLFVAFSALALLPGCSNFPEACMDPNITLAEVGEEIAFANCSLFAENNDWDFADGTTSTDYHPRHTYTSTGEYLVVLTVTDKNGNRPDQVSEIVMVGDRHLSYINVDALPATNSGNEWDAVGDAADPQLFMKPSASSTWSFNTTENTNTTNSVPFIWDLSTSGYTTTYASWDFLLLDNDGATADTMGNWTINLDSVIAGRIINLTGNGCDLKVHYTLN